MTPIPNKLMPYLQALVALIIVLLFCAVTIGPMVAWKPADVDMKETLKAIMFILTGFLFGSAVSSAKKDDQNALLTQQLVVGPTPPGTPGTTATVKIDDDSTPVKVDEVKKP